MTDKTEVEIEKFFSGRESSFKLFKYLRKLIEKNYSPKIEVSKTQISFGEDYKYIWVWLPQTWVFGRPEESITVSIMTGDKINNERIVESVSPKKGFWTHHILINNKKDLDKEIETLINASYEFYLKRKALKDKRKPVKKAK